MKVFGAINKWFKAKDQEAAQKIEDSNIVAFAQQDLEQLRAEYNKAVTNCGNIKARMMSLQDEIKEKSEDIQQRTTDAEKLLELGKEELATKQGAVVEGMEKEVTVLKDALAQQEALYVEQEKNKKELLDKLNECETSLKVMKTMDDVQKSNEALTTVDVSSGKSALASFEAREKRMKDKLNASKAIREEQQNGTVKSLDEQTAEALGNKPGSDFIAKLKAKKSPQG